MVGAHTPALCSWPRDACWWSSHSLACRGALTYTWTPRRATRRRCSRVSLGSVFGGWQHTRSSGAQPLASMVSFMAVVTWIAYPLWYTVSTRVVLAPRPTIIDSTRYAGTALGMQSLGAACHRGGDAPEIQPSQVLRYMGTDIYLQGTPTAPRNQPDVRAVVWKQLRPQRLSPDAAMMVLMAKLPSKLLPMASAYRPTAQVHAANDGLMVRGYKHMTGISRHAHTDALWGPWEHGCQGLTRSSHSWQPAVAPEWVWQGAWAKDDFRESETYTLQAHQALRGGCPAVLPQGTTHTIHGAPSSSLRCSGW